MNVVVCKVLDAPLKALSHFLSHLHSQVVPCVRNAVFNVTAILNALSLFCVWEKTRFDIYTRATMCHQRDIISCRPLCVFLSQAGIETAGLLDASKWFYSMEDIFNIWIFFWNFVHIHSLHRLTEFRHRNVLSSAVMVRQGWSHNVINWRPSSFKLSCEGGETASAFSLPPC